MSTARTTRLSRCRRTSVRLLSASGAASVVLASFLLGALDFALVKATTTPRRVEPFGLLEGLPGEAVAQGYDWSGRSAERHRGQIRRLFGFRRFSEDDEVKLAGWLADEGAAVELAARRPWPRAAPRMRLTRAGGSMRSARQRASSASRSRSSTRLVLSTSWLPRRNAGAHVV